MFKANSPINIYAPVISPANGLLVQTLELDVYFWAGSKSTPPTIFDTDNLYIITKINSTTASGSTPLQTTGSFKFDVSELMKDKIDFLLPPSLNSNMYILPNSIWFKVDSYYIPFSGASSFPNIQATSLVNLGYSYGNAIENEQTPVNRILLDTTVQYKVSRNGTFNIPFIGFELYDAIISVTSQPSGLYNHYYTNPASNIASQLTANVVVNMNDIPQDDTSLKITTYNEIGGIDTTFYVAIEDECIEVPTDLAFINKDGGLQFITFFKSKFLTLSVTSDNFNSRLGRVSDGYHQDTLFNIAGKTKTKINSGFVDESMNRVFKQLLLSKRVWEITTTRTFNPVTITTNSLSYKTRLNDKLIRYEIEYENAYNEIQQY